MKMRKKSNNHQQQALITQIRNDQKALNGLLNVQHNVFRLLFCVPRIFLSSLSLLLFLYIGVKYNYIRLYWFLRLFAINGIAVTAAVAAIAVVVAVFSRFYYYYWLCPLFSFAFAPCGLSKNKWIEQWMNSSQQVHVIKLQFVMNHSTATTTSATNQNTPTWTTHRTHGKI